MDLTSSNNRHQAISCGCKFEKSSSSPKGIIGWQEISRKNLQGTNPGQRKGTYIDHLVILVNFDLHLFLEKYYETFTLSTHHLPIRHCCGTSISCLITALSDSSWTLRASRASKKAPSKRICIRTGPAGTPVSSTNDPSYCPTSTLVDQQRKKGQWKRKKKDETGKTKKEEMRHGKEKDKEGNVWYWILSILLSL